MEINKNTFRKILSNQYLRKILFLISPKILMSYRYLLMKGRLPNLKAPKLFDEKLIWLNLYWRHPLKTVCADKYLVRNYVKQKHLEHILIPLIGVYRTPEEINLEHLPDKFALKCNHGCKFNIFCTGKSSFDLEKAKKKLAKWQKINYSSLYGELHYAGIKPMILAEEFLEDGSGKLPIDYKIYCFNGKAHFLMLCLERGFDLSAKYFAYFDRNLNKLPSFICNNLAGQVNVLDTKAYNKLFEYADQLAKPFPFVRIDFYLIKDKPFLGEMTFTPSGCIEDITQEAQITMGNLLTLPEKLL